MDAQIIKTDGTIQDVAPADGKAFSLEEMQRIVGGYIEIIPSNDGRLIVLNEEGKLHNLPGNPAATVFFARGVIADDDYIVGDVLVTPNEFVD